MKLKREYNQYSINVITEQQQKKIGKLNEWNPKKVEKVIQENIYLKEGVARVKKEQITRE